MSCQLKCGLTEVHCLCSSLSAVVNAKFTSKFTKKLCYKLLKHTRATDNPQGCFTCRLHVGSGRVCLFVCVFFSENSICLADNKRNENAFSIGMNCAINNFIIIKPSVEYIVSIDLYVCKVFHRQS